MADRADNLEEAISELLRNSLEELLKTLGENVPSGLANSLTELTEIALGVSKPLDDAFSSIQKSYDVLHDFKDVMDSGFDDHVTDDLLSSVASLSGELNTMVAGFYAGAVTADELYNALTQHYEIDLENYGKALVAKNELNEDFYNNIGMTSAEVVEQFSKDYGIDLKNCKSYAEAKIAIEEQTLKTISAAWSSYYDAQSRTFKNLGGGRSELEARAAHGSGDAAEILKQIDAYEVAMDALDDVVYHGLSANFEKISNKIGSESSSSSSSAKDFEETFDWIETAIDRIERSISNLGLKADSVYDRWSSRNSALQGELSAVGNEIAIQQAGYEKYMREASSVGLSEEWASKVRNGQIDINSITNEDLADRIKEYQSWYEKALDCQDAIAELNETVSELYENSFDNVVAQYDSILSAVENSKNMLDEAINQTEEHGYIVNAAYYEALMRTEKTNIEQMEKERDALVSALNDAVKSGAIEEGSQAWADMQEQISEVTLSIEEANTAMIQYGNSIRDIQWQLFDLLQDRISLITAESDFLIDLLSNDKLYDERGQLTSEGNSTMGLHGQNYNVYMEQADKYAKEILRINSEIANDPHNQDLIDRRNELLELQQESILAAEDEKQAIVDMVEEGINLELESLKELIDTYNDALDAQKDLYDYQKNIAEQTKEIASLRKQLSAYEGDLSEENRARIQQIKVQLEDAEENLEETQYERYISDQKKLLDELYLEYETVLNQRLDGVDALMADMISEINQNASSISETLSSKAESVGYTLSESMYDIWSNSTGTITNVLEMYGSNLISGIDNIDTSVEDVISGITDTVDSIGTVNTTITGAIDSVTSSLQSILNALSSTNSGISSNVNYSSSVGSYSEVATGNTNTSSASGSSSAANGFFIYKKNNYPKNRLNINTSIVDRLKYHDFDDSFDARRGYYSKMGLPGTYTGTNTQNAQMINWMKVHGYKNGVYNLRQSEWAWTQENGAEAIIRPSDGAVLTPLVKGDTVLNADTTRNLLDLINSPKDFIKEQMGKMTVPNRTVHDNISNDIQMTITLPNVQNYEQFKYAMQHDPNFEKMVQAMTVGRAAGKGSLRKYSM